MNNEYEKDFNSFYPKGQGIVNNEVTLGIKNIVPAIEVPGSNTLHVPKIPKKNRTLQFYKFLFYSMKLEIKLYEFYDLVRFSNQSEITLWILSLVLYFNSPKEFSNMLVWIHIIHLIRGLVGFLILIKLPRSYTVVESMKNVPEKELETKLFNDIVRDIANREIIQPMQKSKSVLVLYFILTFINFIFDIIDFLYVLSNIDKVDDSNSKKVILLSFLIIAFLYIAIDCSYIFWTNSLYYTFPETYLLPIRNAVSGAIETLKIRLRIGKKETDIKKEVEIQTNINPNINEESIKQDIVPPVRTVNQDNIHIEINENYTKQNKYPYMNNNNNQKGNYTNKIQNYLEEQEENLDK